MARIIQLFPDGVPITDQAKARREESVRLQKLLLDRNHTSELLGPDSQHEGDKSELMPTPDEVAGRWGRGDYAIYDEMGRNVLAYRALHDGRIDVVTSLSMVVLPGQKGNKDSEEAAEEVWSMFENLDERMIGLKSAGRFIERGFSGLEMVWGMHTRGKAAGMIGPVALIDRPIDWFAFDWLNRPYFKRKYYAPKDAVPLADYKVMFGRHGSLHTAYGRGIGQDDYPAVWTIDAVMKGHLKIIEKFGFLPAVVTYPEQWKAGRINTLRIQMEQQWKNVLLVPGEVDQARVTFPSTDAAYAASNASGQSRMQIIRIEEAWLAQHIQGSMYSSGNQAEGSFARDQVADSARLYKAPGDATCYEAMLNRGFVRPVMLVNRPQLDESLWPRFAIDASFGEDLRLLLSIFESGARMRVPISHVTFSERFKIPLANDEQILEGKILEGPAVPQFNGEPVEVSDELGDSIAKTEKAFSEGGTLINVSLKDGGQAFFDPALPVYTSNRGVVRASLLQKGDVPMLPESMIRRAS